MNKERAAADSVPAVLKQLWSEPPRAAAFIVTIYGDIVEPRGGVLWMGNLIEVCGTIGISESLVRTAVSRLVSAGQLSGERDGRRSFYRLTDRARVEFLQAAKILFDPDPAPEGFLITPRPPADQEAGFLRQGFAVAGAFLIGPDRSRSPEGPVNSGLPGPVFRAETIAGGEELPAFASRYWDLDTLADAYGVFLERYGRLSDYLASGEPLHGADAMTARLMLVHDYRFVLLRDPRLPEQALPKNWPGYEARTRFAKLYRRLAPETDRYTGMHLQSVSGILSASTEATEKRLRTIAGHTNES
ncbi:PaaX family transcriptional regulator C-terminal domain-containing protein [uncultured Roseibium sp.]|uniref:PaaX family transcriptional regulator C-terminal domain-containing protein n=1 Tax=uncultured Roseibium sp. TaxID=1936171 RepID=UPI00321624E2